MRLRMIGFFVVVVAVVSLLYAYGGPKRDVPAQSALTLDGSASAKFTPFAVSFANAEKGWVLGTVPCTVRPACMQLRMTRNFGTTWRVLRLPTSLLKVADQRNLHTIAAVSYGLNLHFANPRDGWIYGTVANFDYYGGITTSRWLVILWSTHNGGTTWTKESPPGIDSQGPTFDLESSKSEVYLLAQSPKFTAVLVESPLNHDHWNVVATPPLGFPAGGSNPTGSIVLSGNRGWLVEGNDRGVTGSLRLTQHGEWIPWSPPCESVGDSYVTPIVVDDRSLLVLCQMGGFASPLSSSAPPGATLGSFWLYESNSAGTSFHALGELRPVHDYFYALTSPSPNVVFFTFSAGTTDQLAMSTDSGRHWHTAFHGLVTYLHFANATYGVGLSETRMNTYEMIMTRDGGRSWNVERFMKSA